MFFWHIIMFATKTMGQFVFVYVVCKYIFIWDNRCHKKLQDEVFNYIVMLKTHPFAPDMHHTSKLPHRQVSSQTRDTMFCEHLKLSRARNKHTQAYPPLKLAAKAPKNGWLEDNPFLSGRLFLKLWFSGKVILTCADPTKFPKETLPNSMVGVQKHIQPNVLMSVMWWFFHHHAVMEQFGVD